MDVRQTAYDAVSLGFSVVPPREDGSKAPAGKEWKTYQSRLPTRAELDGWYGTEGCGPPRRSGVGLVLGKISGDAECLEFDGKGRAYGPFKELARATGLGDLIERLEEGYLEGSPAGGVHLLYRCPGAIEGNQVFARHESSDINPKTGKPIPRPLIETRGEGGYLVIAPSNGRVHPSGGAYVLLSGGLKSMPVITPEERAALFEVARTFDEMPVPEPKPRPRPKPSAGSAGDLTPWEDYQARTAWEEVLVGWTRAYEKDGQTYWRRPGKGRGVSASTGRCKHDRLFVWSTSTEFRAGLVGDKADAFSYLHCGGDFSKAVRELRGRGFGTPRPTARDGGDGPRLGEGRRRVHGEVPAEAVSIPAGRSLDARLAWYPHTELGNAERLVERSGEGIRYVGRWKKFLAWDGARWVTDYLGRAMRRAKRTTRLMLAEAATIKHEDPKKEAELVEGLTRWARASEKKRALDAMLALAATEKEIAIEHDVLDSHRMLLNVMNGTIDLTDGSLNPHRREDMLTHLAPVAYDRDAECPLWDATLELVQGGDEEMIAFLRRLAGVFLSGLCTEHILPIFHGEGSNGKSTMVQALIGVLGPDLAMPAMPGMLMLKKHASHPTEIAMLRGKRLIVQMESGQDERIDEEKLKNLTGNDRIATRGIGEDPWSFDPTHTLVMCTNYKPVIRGTDLGIWRRLLLIPFTVCIPADKVDKDMPAKLRAEYPGILTWMVRGCLEWQREGLNPPEKVLAATEEYRQSQDILQRFFAEECILSTAHGVMAKAGELYDRFKAWAEKGGEKDIMSGKEFGERIKTDQRFKCKRESSGMFYHGIGLRPG